MIKLALVQPSPAAAQLWSKLATLQIEVWSLDPGDSICIVFCSRIKGWTRHLAHLTQCLANWNFICKLSGAGQRFVCSMLPPHIGWVREIWMIIRGWALPGAGLVPTEVWTKAWCITLWWLGLGLVSVSERSKCHCLMDYGRCPRTLPRSRHNGPGPGCP